MPRKRSDGSGIPRWFALSNYDHLSSMDATGWTRVVADLALARQEDTSLYFEGLDRDDRLAVADKLFSGLATDRSAKFAEHVIRSHRDAEHNLKFGGVWSLDNGVVARMAATLAHFPEGPRAIESMSDILSRVLHREPLPERTHRLLRKHGGFLRKPYFLTLREASLFQNTEVASTPNRAVSVNLELPDEILIEDFRRWLRQVRELDKQPVAPRPFGPSDYQRWIEHGYVPLLVLRMWAEYTDTSLTWQDLATAAFPASMVVSENNVRRTYWPGAEKWATKETMHALAAQAAKDAGALPPPKNRGDLHFRQPVAEDD